MRLTSLFVALSILLVGHGLQQTILPMTGSALGWPASIVSLLGAAYFSGFIVGCYRIPRWIRRVGHARVFSACAGLAAIAVLTYEFSRAEGVWLAARVLTGFSFAGIYLIIESWLNGATANERRGSVMSLYSLISLIALTAGQFLANLDLTTAVTLAAMAFCLSIYPVALTRVDQPETPKDVRLSFRTTYNASQVAPVASAVSGFAMGLSWSVGAVYATQALGSQEAGTQFITCMLLGGICSLIPAGRLSDRVDRRFVIFGISLLGCLTSIYTWASPITFYWTMFAAFILGAAAMPLYSLAIAHANDNADADFIVVGGTLLVANGVGSIVGPFVYSAYAAFAPDYDTFFLLITIAFFVNAIWTATRILIHTAPREYFEPYQAVSRTTLGAVELDPRADHAPDSSSQPLEYPSPQG